MDLNLIHTYTCNADAVVSQYFLEQCVLDKSDAVLAQTPAGFTGSSGNALGSCSVDTDTILGSAPKPSTT